MSEMSRAWNLVRGYAGQLRNEWDRLSGVEISAAEKELEEASDIATPSGAPPKSEDALAPISPTERLVQARRILGTDEKTPFADTKKIYERLLKRCDPTRFLDGSIEAAQAASIRKRVEWAFAVVRDSADTTEARFSTLEID